MPFIATCPYCGYQVRAHRRQMGEIRTCQGCASPIKLMPAVLLWGQRQPLRTRRERKKDAVPVARPAVPPSWLPSMAHRPSSGEKDQPPLLIPLELLTAFEKSPQPETPPQPVSSLPTYLAENTQTDLPKPLLPVATPAVPGPPARRKRTEPEPLDEEDVERVWPAWGVAALVLSALGLVVLFFPVMRWVSLVLGMGAVVCGLVAWQKLGWRHRGGPLWPLGSWCLGGIVILLSVIWPGFLSRRGDSLTPPRFDPQKIYQVFPRQPPRLPETEWIDAREYRLRKGDWVVQIKSVALGPLPPNVTGPALDRRNPYFQVLVNLYNAGVKDPIPYRSWSDRGSDGRSALLRDSSGKTFNPLILSGSSETKTIPPMANLEDCLVFEAPSGEAAYLHLELPAVGQGDASFQFLIPRSMFQRR